MSAGILWKWNEAFFSGENACGRRGMDPSHLLPSCFLHRCSHLSYLHHCVVSSPPSNSSPPTVLALEEIKHSLTHFCLLLSPCMAGLLSPPCWKEQEWEQLCWLLVPRHPSARWSLDVKQGTNPLCAEARKALLFQGNAG